MNDSCIPFGWVLAAVREEPQATPSRFLRCFVIDE